MATQNLTRDNGRHKKREVKVFTTVLDYTDEIGTSADAYQLVTLPENCLVISAGILVLAASDAATTAVADLGFAGGDTLVDGGNLKSAVGTNLSGGTNAAIPQLTTTPAIITFLPTYTGATTVGKFQVTVEYIEIDMTNGEVTNFSAT